MPIFQDDLGGERSPNDASSGKHTMASLAEPRDGVKRKESEESIRTELCEGHLPDPLRDQEDISPSTKPDFTFPILGSSDRVELIERLKRSHAPWIPSRGPIPRTREQRSPSTALSENSHTPPLFPSPEISESGISQRLQAGQEIERPRSALHSGDFTERLPQPSTESSKLRGSHTGIYSSERQEWLATSPPRHFSPFALDSRFPPVDPIEGARSRAPSLSSSLSSSFVMKPPTSPLVHSESNEDLDFSTNLNPIDITSASQRNLRRHTLHASSVHSTPSVPTASSFRLPHLRRDNTYPYQAHQPRRSLTTNMLPDASPSPQTPLSQHSRRPSFTSDSSPLHASMVGSYEESILRGRMSTNPSKPLDFVAQIGVLGLGKCKANLKCPAHVTIPFPAVFYSYETTTHGRSGKLEDGPSPYVGHIDIENNLQNPEEVRNSRRKRRDESSTVAKDADLDMLESQGTNHPPETLPRRVIKQKRRSTSPRSPPGGSYRIPEQGQLQIIIKNPNKTAVKLFLVPYDLTGMEPGTKTFIRQRSYSAGPIIDSALSSSSQLSTSRSADRPTLRYLIHLHICSPSRNRFYLYKSIRVVFANRVPDGKEKLQNEISLPHPKFSVYKPSRDSMSGIGFTGGAGASLTAEKAYRRRSAGYALSHSERNYAAMDGIPQGIQRTSAGGLAFPHAQNLSNSPIQPIQFSLYHKSQPAEIDSGQDRFSSILSPTSSRSSRPPTSQGSEMSWTSNSGIGGYDKLSKGDLGYGGNVFATSPDGRQVVAEGLLAQKLRTLGVASLNQSEGSDGA